MWHRDIHADNRFSQFHNSREMDDETDIPAIRRARTNNEELFENIAHHSQAQSPGPDSDSD